MFFRVNENATILWQKALYIRTDVTLDLDSFYRSVQCEDDDDDDDDFYLFFCLELPVLSSSSEVFLDLQAGLK